MSKPRFVASPYSYCGNSSRARSYSVWDTVEKEWASGYVGNKQGAQEGADALNNKFYECPRCSFVQFDDATADQIKCDRCDHVYYPA